MTDAERAINDEIRELERKAQALKRQASDRREREERAREDAFILKEGIHTNSSDDYWTLTVGKHCPIYKEGTPAYAFYYGYGRTMCPDHGKACPGCGNQKWAFTAEIGGIEVMRLPASALAGNPGWNGSELLLAGIAMFIRDRMTLKEAEPTA